MRLRNKIYMGSVLLCGIVLTMGSVAAYKAYRLKNVANEIRHQIHYLTENNETIGGAPAETTFSVMTPNFSPN